MTAKKKGSLLLDGDMHVASQCNPLPSGDCPPDVYTIQIGADTLHLCIKCCAMRLIDSSAASLGPYIEGGTCEDCGSQAGLNAPEGITRKK